MSRRVLINTAAFGAMFVLMIWWAVNNIVTFDFLEKPYEIEGEFAATAGVSSNSEVSYLGLNYGYVRSVETRDGIVVITMAIDRGKTIPAGSEARIFRKSAIGEPYIDFHPPEDFEAGDPVYEAGDVVPLASTSVPLEFSELLRAASRVLAAVEPEQTRTLVHELAVALEGRGEALRSLTIDSDALLATFADRTDLLDDLTTNSTRLTRTVVERRGDIEASVANLAEIAQTIRTVQPSTDVLLSRGTDLLRETADLVADVKGNLDCILRDLDGLVELTSSPENLDNLRFLLDEGPTGFDYVFMTRDDEPGGVWVRVNLLVNPANPPTQYVPRTSLPAVPEIPACVSTLSTGGVRFEEGTSGGSPVPFLPATGLERSVVGLLAVLAGAGAVLVGRRRLRR